MKLVVVGAGGGLGRAFLSVVSGHDIDAFTHAQLDIGDEDAVSRALVPLEADAILNFAAYTKVDACESDPESARLADEAFRNLMGSIIDPEIDLQVLVE